MYYFHTYSIPSVKHPMHCLQFLKALKSRLDVSVEGQVGTIGGLKNKKGSNLDSSAGKTKNDKKSNTGPRTGGLTLISALALTNAHMSRPSIDCLKVCLIEIQKLFFNSVECLCTMYVW